MAAITIDGSNNASNNGMNNGRHYKDVQIRSRTTLKPKTVKSKREAQSASGAGTTDLGQRLYSWLVRPRGGARKYHGPPGEGAVRQPRSEWIASAAASARCCLQMPHCMLGRLASTATTAALSRSLEARFSGR